MSADPRFTPDPKEFELDASQFATSLDEPAAPSPPGQPTGAASSAPSGVTAPAQPIPPARKNPAGQPTPEPPDAPDPSFAPKDAASEEAARKIRHRKQFLTFVAIYLFMAAAAALIGFLNVAESEEARGVWAPFGALAFCLLWACFVAYVARLGKKR